MTDIERPLRSFWVYKDTPLELLPREQGFKVQQEDGL